jgi:GDPmannose 4,6-dehydratase
MIFQQDEPEDFVIATGVTTSVKEFVVMAFGEMGVTIEFKGSGVNEKGYVAACDNDDYPIPVGKQVVSVDPAYFRPTEVDLLIGDATKARTKLGWEPASSLSDLVTEMVGYDLQLLSRQGPDFIHMYAEAS